MANSPQAIKRARQNQKRNLHNASQHSETRSALKNTLKAIEKGSKEEAKTFFNRAVILLDRLAARNIIHPNKAARLKSRLNKKLILMG